MVRVAVTRGHGNTAGSLICGPLPNGGCQYLDKLGGRIFPLSTTIIRRPAAVIPGPTPDNESGDHRARFQKLWGRRISNRITRPQSIFPTSRKETLLTTDTPYNYFIQMLLILWMSKNSILISNNSPQFIQINMNYAYNSVLVDIHCIGILVSIKLYFQIFWKSRIKLMCAVKIICRWEKG